MSSGHTSPAMPDDIRNDTLQIYRDVLVAFTDDGRHGMDAHRPALDAVSEHVWASALAARRRPGPDRKRMTCAEIDEERLHLFADHGQTDALWMTDPAVASYHDELHHPDASIFSHPADDFGWSQAAVDAVLARWPAGAPGLPTAASLVQGLVDRVRAAAERARGDA